MTAVEVKTKVRARDGHRCTKCGMTRAEHFAKYEHDLDVHRLTPGSEYTMEGCVTICRACHGPEPKRPKGERWAIEGFTLRLRGVFWEQLDKLVERNGSDQTEEIRIAIRERLERAGLWPPPPPAAPQADKE